MSKISYFILLGMLFIPSLVSSQTSEKYLIKGVIVDTTAVPIVGAVVSLSTIDDASILYQMSDSVGQYNFLLGAGQYKLKVEHISYYECSKIIEVVGNTILDRVKLTIKPNNIETVNVFGSRIKYGYDNYVVSMQNNPVTEGKNISEALAYLPYVSKADGGLKVLGEDVSRIRINGMPITDTKELEAIQANNVDKVEVILRNQYDQSASGSGGEINIKLKKMPTGGFYGSVTGQTSAYFKYGYGGSSANSSFSYGIKNLSIYNYINLSDDKIYSENMNTVLYKNEDKQRTSIRNAHTPTKFISDRLSITYDINENHNIGLSLRYSGRLSTPSSSSVSSVTGVDSNDNSQAGSINSGRVMNHQYQTALIYNWQFNEKGSSFKLTGDYLSHKTNTEQAYKYNYNIGQNDHYSSESKNQIDSKVDMYYVNAQFNIVAGSKSRVRVGANYDNNRTAQLLDYCDLSADSWIVNDLLSDDYRLLGDNYMGFASFDSKIGSKWAYSLSTRYKHRQMRYNSIKIGQANTQRLNNMEYAASLTHFINRQRGDQLTLSYNRWVFDLPYSAISPVVTYIDEYSYTKGNLELEPSSADNVTFILGLKNKTQLLVRLQRVNKDEVYRTFTDQQNPLVTYTMPFNGVRSYNVRLNIDHRLDITSWWKLYVEGLLEWRKFTSPYTKRDNSWVSFLSLSNTLNFTNHFGATLDCFIKSKTMYAERTYGPVTTLDLSVFKYFCDKKFRLAINYTAYNRERWTLIETDNLRDRHYPRTNQARASIGLTYNFNGGKSMRVKQTNSVQSYNEIKDELLNQ